MKTTVKTVRFDNQFLEIVEDFKRIQKEAFGIDISVNSLLAGSAVHGLDNYLGLFRMIDSGVLKPTDKESKKLVEKVKKSGALDFLQKYEQYKHVIDTEDYEKDYEDAEKEGKTNE